MSKIKYLNVEVADSPHKVQKGLMFRSKLPDNNGMLFSFPREDVLSFWGMNTHIPLDIAFVNNNNAIDSIQKIRPHDLTAVKSSKSCLHAIEANEGWFKRNDISNGDFVEIFNDRLGNRPKVFFITKTESTKTAQAEDQNLLGDEDQGLDTIPRDRFFDSDNIEDSDLLADNEDLDPEIDQETEDVVDEIQADAREYIDTEDVKPEEIEIQIPEFSSVFQAIDWGKINNQTMILKYKTLKGSVIVREVEPHDMFFARTTRRQIMVTFDKQVGAPRSFIVMNILEYSFNGIPFSHKFIVI